MQDRDLCANCDRWREEHYNLSGVFVANLLDPPCVEYAGTFPSETRRKQKDKDLKRAAEERAEA